MYTQNEQANSFDQSSLSHMVLTDMRSRLEKLLIDSTKSDVYFQFEEFTGLSEKSLRNWLTSKNLPYPQSIEAFYVLFLKLKFEELPDFVLKYFKSKNYKSKSHADTKEMSEWLKGKPLHTKIYRMLKIGHSVDLNVISGYFGKIGTNCIKDLENIGLLRIDQGYAKLTSITVNPSMKYFLTCAENHINSFSFLEISEKPASSANKFSNMIYEISKEDVSGLWTELHQAQYAIFEKYSNNAKGDIVIVESTTLLDQLDMNKKDIIQ